MIDRFFEQFSVLLKEDYYNIRWIERENERDEGGENYDWHIGWNREKRKKNT